MGIPVTLFRSNSTELWINVTNNGKTPIKRMRARLRFKPLPKPVTRRQRPDGISDENWQQMQRLHEEFEMRMQREIEQSQYGRPLSFSSRTPRGTIGRPWVEADNRVSYELDLSPNSDEASIEAIALFPLDPIALMDLEKAGVMKFGRPADQPLPTANVVAVMIGNNSGLVMNPTGAGLYQDLALKFWTVSENISKDVSEIFHIEIPNSLNAIVCTKLKKRSGQYKEFEKMLSA